MAVLIIHQHSTLAFKGEGQAPVTVYRYRIMPGKFAGQCVQSPSRYIHILGRFGEVKPCQPWCVGRLYAGLASLLEKGVQPFVPECLDHRPIV
jgi:hypothetical protein